MEIRSGLYVLLVLLSSNGRTQVAKGPNLVRETLDVAVADLLKANKVSGGIEIFAGCKPFEEKTFEIVDRPLDSALARLAQAEPSLSWRKNEKTYLATIKLVDSPSLTAAKLPPLQLKVRTLWQATDSLLQHRATQNRVAELKLSSGPEHLGTSSIYERDERTISLPAGTLQDDLNTVAAAFGSAMWQLNQRECGETRTFRLSWIAR